jgi:hypothetical protein
VSASKEGAKKAGGEHWCRFSNSLPKNGEPTRNRRLAVLERQAHTFWASRTVQEQRPLQNCNDGGRHRPPKGKGREGLDGRIPPPSHHGAASIILAGGAEEAAPEPATAAAAPESAAAAEGAHEGAVADAPSLPADEGVRWHEGGRSGLAAEGIVDIVGLFPC